LPWANRPGDVFGKGILISLTIETECDSTDIRCLLSAAVTRTARHYSRGLDRMLIGGHPYRVPRCRLVRPLSIPGVEMARAPARFSSPGNQPLQVLAVHGLAFQGHAQAARQGRMSAAAPWPRALTDLPRSKTDAVEAGRPGDPLLPRRDIEMSRRDEYSARQSRCAGPENRSSARGFHKDAR